MLLKLSDDLLLCTFFQNLLLPSPMSSSPSTSPSLPSPSSVCLPEDEVVAGEEPDIETVDVMPKLNFDVSDFGISGSANFFPRKMHNPFLSNTAFVLLVANLLTQRNPSIRRGLAGRCHKFNHNFFLPTDQIT